MTTSFVLVLPEQELAVLQSAARQSPQFAHLLKQLPGFNAALSAPLPDHLAFIAQQAYSAASEVQANTNYPENWDELRDTCRNLRKQYNKLQAKQQLAQAQPVVPVEGGCPSCGSHRKVFSQSAGDAHWLSIPHLAFNADYTYTPADMGIPKDGSDGPSLSVCLDCGRVLNGTYPVSDKHLKKRIARYQGNC